MTNATQPSTQALADLIQAGAMMANCMYNYAQRTGMKLTVDQCEGLDGLRKQWDAARSAMKDAPDMGIPISESVAQSNPSAWAVSHNGKTVEAETLSKAMGAARSLRTEAEALTAAQNLMQVIEQELADSALLGAEDMKDLQRFNECAEDSEAGGHDVSTDAMRRLAEIGVVRSIGFGRHEMTSFGRHVLKPESLPLMTRQDAARWREVIRHVGAVDNKIVGAQRFRLAYLTPIDGANIMRGSVAGHFSDAIDAAIKAQEGKS